MIHLLLDENLSPWVAHQLRIAGHDVVHVRERGLLGSPDHVVVARASDESRILVTANVGDFRRLASARELHAGMVMFIEGGLLRDEQLKLLERVVETVTHYGDMTNVVLTVRIDGELEIEELPAFEE